MSFDRQDSNPSKWTINGCTPAGCLLIGAWVIAALVAIWIIQTIIG